MEEEYEAYLDQRNVDPETKAAYKKAVLKAMKYFEARGLEFEEAGVADFEAYIDHLISVGENSEDNILGVARYVYLRDMKEVWIYFAAIIGGREILPSIADRLEEIAGKEVADEVCQGRLITILCGGSGRALATYTIPRIIDCLAEVDK